LAALEEAQPRDPTPYVVEVPLDVLDGDAEVLDVWMREHGVDESAAVVPPKLTVKEWTARYSRPPGDS
jgi:hypothetical protein